MAPMLSKPAQADANLAARLALPLRHLLIFLCEPQGPEKSTFSSDEITHFFNATPEITNWGQIVTNVYALSTSLSVNLVGTRFRDYALKNRGLSDVSKIPVHVFFEADLNGYGILYKVVWGLLNDLRQGVAKSVTQSVTKADDLEDEIPF